MSEHSLREALIVAALTGSSGVVETCGAEDLGRAVEAVVKTAFRIADEAVFRLERERSFTLADAEGLADAVRKQRAEP